MQLQAFGEGRGDPPAHGHVTHRGWGGELDLIKGKQHAYRIKQVYPKHTTKTLHRVGLAVPTSHTVQTAWPVRRPAATLIGESKDGREVLAPHILALPADLANNSCSINDSLVDDGG